MSADSWVLLPLGGFAGLVALELSARSSLAEAFLRAVVWWVATVWIMANALGAFSALHGEGLRVAWMLLGVGLLGFGTWRFAATRRVMTVNWPQLRGGEWAFVFAGSGLMGLALITAIFSPPVTVDVLNYHLPRQLMWLQQGSLEHFVTINDRALMMPPLAEVIGLQFLGLTGADHGANLPQWIAYAALPIAVGKMARSLGASRGAALLAGWLVLCLPMAYHEASNGKNDLQGAFWITLLAWRAVAARQQPSSGRSDAVFAGVILALALLTKSTAFIFAPPLLWIGWLGWKRHQSAHYATTQSLTVALVCLMLVTPFFVRNVAWYGHPLGVHRAEDGGEQVNTLLSPAAVASNAIRNGSSHLAGPWPTWNEAVYRTVVAAHRGLGLSVNDPRTTLWSLEYSVEYGPGDETKTGAPFSLFALMVAALATLLVKRARSWRWLALTILSMGLLYCVVLKWQPWGARLQLPIFVLGSVLVAGVVGTLMGRRQSCVLGGVALIGALAWWPTREDLARPLWTSPTIFSVPRELNQYRYLPFLRERDHQFTELLRASGATNIAIVSIHDITYPLMRNLAREIDGLHFYGAPVGDGEHVAEAYVQLGLVKPLPLYFSIPGAERFRLVGAGLGDGIYLPESKVDELGWSHLLPDFAGWRQSHGIRVGADTRLFDGQLHHVRYLPSGGGSVDFEGSDVPIYLTAVVVNPDRTSGVVEIVLNGTLVSREEIPPHPGFYKLQVVLRGAPGVNRVEFLRADGTARELIFTQLILNDVPPIALP